MGRRTLYSTEDEKKAAKQARDKRYYDKSRLKICSKKREKYAVSKQRSSPTGSQSQSVGISLSACNTKRRVTKCTDEERRLRNRRKSGLSYQRNKSKIQARRRNGGQQPQVAHQSAHQPIPFWKQEVDRLEARLERYLGGMNAYNYVGGIIRRFRANWDAGPLERAQAAFGSLLSDIERLEADVLQTFGCGEEMKRVGTVYLQVRSLIQCLDDVECYILQGDIEEAYTQGLFMYLKL